ncbi:L,D-transpeptidase [Methylobacterium sp. WL6]|jgi:lipoprotein-anchoring transpeptidase ErfK/SrfK|uniref:L,D-transpeptidase n=1 Tax=Methylobacterium sp. WL6 TaxID=2603901 RepID=UPI0011CBDA47|nr:L,D-transpeptidase [Methylobacterium sp. WL6]TXN61548.1 L,D-transpeptidase [Methylobacterium sp. WL6]
MRTSWCVGAALAASVWSGAVQAQARYAEPDGYGGGLIEYLVTGGVAPRGGARPVAVARPGYAGASAQSGDPIEPYGGASRAYAALPQGLPAQADPPAESDRIARAPDPRYARQEVAFSGPQRPGTIVIDTPSKYLYLVQPGGRAMRYGIGVGRPGFAWSGLKTVSRKAEWPGWTPPPEMLARRPDLPRHMEGGPGNPLGARALYLGSSLYRIHGTNEPHTIGQNVSSGCIRMMNDDVVDLYERVPVGTRVEVM